MEQKKTQREEGCLIAAFKVIKMSQGPACKCEAKKDKGQFWRVLQRGCNHSAFNGYKRTPSDYSTVICLKCRALWRTKADFVSLLLDYKNEVIG